MVEKQIVKRNAERMAQIATERGLSLRPHVKTHKTMYAARLILLVPHPCNIFRCLTHREAGLYQVGAQQPRKIVASTLAEVKYFAKGGFNDILYGVPITVDKVHISADPLSYLA